jgi:aminoglycoside phosphotransferase (APT) family kinase protein
VQLTVDRPEALRDDARIDRARLAAFLTGTIPGLVGTMELLQFHAGHSNLTYLARFGERELVLKRAPLGPHAKGAHDMGREYHVLSVLHGVYRYAPRALAVCEDASIAGSAFCVMERAAGIIVRGAYPADVTEAQIAGQFEHLVDGMIELHALDPEAVGLADFGRPLGYRRRQVEGWAKRLDAARTDDLVNFSAIRAWLAANTPLDPEVPAVVHNDFKLDNLVWETGDVTVLKAVLDWEMTTLGDGAMDLACTLSFWPESADPKAFRKLRAMPTLYASVPTRAAVRERYAQRTGRDVPSLAFLLCFGYFRRATIEQQKYVRFRRGDTADPRFGQLHADVRVLHAMCERAIAGELG